MNLFSGIANVARRWVRKGAFVISVILASSIPAVDMLDVWFSGSVIADVADGLLTIVFCVLLSWLVKFLDKETKRLQERVAALEEER